MRDSLKKRNGGVTCSQNPIARRQTRKRSLALKKRTAWLKVSFATSILLMIFASSSQAVSSQLGVASFYSTEACKYNIACRSNPNCTCPTASGASLYRLEKEKILFAAKWEVPFGTKIRVTNQENGKEVVVTILDRGPAKRLGRIIDLGKEAFSKIADLKEGLIEVKLEYLGGV